MQMKSSKRVSHFGGRLFETQWWSMSYTMHELNLFKQITRLRKKVSINKPRIAAFLEEKQMCINASFTQYLMYKVQNPFSERKPFHQLLCDIDPLPAKCRWQHFLSSGLWKYSQESYPSEPIVMEVEQVSKRTKWSGKCSVLKIW